MLGGSSSCTAVSRSSCFAWQHAWNYSFLYVLVGFIQFGWPYSGRPLGYPFELQLRHSLSSKNHLSVAKQQLFASSTSLHCLWGSPVTGSSRCGVGMVVKATKFAKVSSICWPSDHPCHSFWATGRFQAALFYLHDNSAFVLYNMYGPAGARESSSR